MVKKAQILFVILLVLLGAVIALFETGTCLQPLVLLQAQVEFWLTNVLTLLTLVLVPLSLKLISLERVRKAISADASAYWRWSWLRWGLLCGILLANTLFYYCFSTGTTCGYLALICAVALLFVWPSQSRMEEECQP